MSPSSLSPQTNQGASSWLGNIAESISQISCELKADLKILGLSILRFLPFQDSVQIEHKIARKLYKVEQKFNKNKYPGLIPTMNMVQKGIFTDPEKYRQATAVLEAEVVKRDHCFTPFLDKGEKASSTSSSPFGAHTLTAGVCMGLCAQVASQVLQQNPEEDSFQTKLINSVKSYEKGGDKEVNANQTVYTFLRVGQADSAALINQLKELKDSNTITPLQLQIIEFLLVVGIIDKDVLDANKEKYSSSLKKHFLPLLQDPRSQFATILKGLSEKEKPVWTTFCLKLGKLSINKSLTSESILETLSEALKDKGVTEKEAQSIKNAAEWLHALTNRMVQDNSKLLVSSLKPSQPSFFAKIVQKIKSAVNSLFGFESSEPALGSRSYLDILKIQKITADGMIRQNAVNNARGFQFEAIVDKTGMVGTKRDKEYLECLQSLEPGVYSLQFSVKDGGHATLYIKTGKEGYFFDPNIGLVQCEEDHKETILKILANYSCPDEAPLPGLGMDHVLEIRKMKSCEHPDDLRKFVQEETKDLATDIESLLQKLDGLNSGKTESPVLLEDVIPNPVKEVDNSSEISWEEFDIPQKNVDPELENLLKELQKLEQSQ